MGTIWAQPLGEVKGPKYQKVADTIRKAVGDGSLKAGSKLPPVRELAFQLSITPGTVARAYSILTSEGLLEAEVGRGTFVAEKKRPVPDDVWARQLHMHEVRTPGVVSLFSPRLADVGQVAAVRDALRQVADGPPLPLMSYPTRDAYTPVRQAVAGWLSDRMLGPLDEQDVVLTHGGQHGLCLAMQAILTGSKPAVLVEDLSYAGFRRAAEQLRADVAGVAINEQGLRPDMLELAARKTSAQVLCTSPEVHNPTGLHTPLERRKEIVAVCRRYGIQILEDDCYRMGEARVPSYRALAPELTWHVSSISKTLTPALRVGFAVAPEGRSADLRRADVRAEMAKYVRVAVNALGGFDLVWDDQVPFLWLRLPGGWRAAAFTRAAEAQGVQLRSADEFALRDGLAPHAVRIALNGQVPLPVFEAAMQRLRSLLDNPPEQISV